MQPWWTKEPRDPTDDELREIGRIATREHTLLREWAWRAIYPSDLDIDVEEYADTDEGEVYEEGGIYEALHAAEERLAMRGARGHVHRTAKALRLAGYSAAATTADDGSLNLLVLRELRPPDHEKMKLLQGKVWL